MGETYFKHSLKVNDYLCAGCTTCMRTCPTGAIRIRGGKAVINDNKCVDCGECMKICPHKAIYIKQDDFQLIENYGYKVCLVPTTFIGQFEEKYKTKAIYSCLKRKNTERDRLPTSTTSKSTTTRCSTPNNTKFFSTSFPKAPHPTTITRAAETRCCSRYSLIC